MATYDVKPSHSDIASLESSFANDPSSNAYQPLAEAYLALGRFMEAMVVCKKGVKAHPDDPSARVLMGRVYADQSKDRKALEEFRAAVELNADHVEANRLLGVMLLTQGDTEEGARRLQRAASVAPDDPKVREACKRWGIDAPAPPPPVPEVASLPGSGFVGSSAPSQVPNAPGPGVAGTRPPVFESGALTDPPGQAFGTPAQTPFGTQENVAASAPPFAQQPRSQPHSVPGAALPPAQYPTTGPMFDDDSLLDADDPLDKKSSLPALLTVGVFVVGVVMMLGWYGIQVRSAERVRRADALLTEAQQALGQGSYANFIRVTELAEESLRFQARGSLGATAHAYLAFANTLRWGEHLEGEVYRDLARRHLEASSEHGSMLTIRVAANAYFDFFSGDTQKAINELRALVEAEGSTAPALASALGHMYLWSGDFGEARRYLGRAREQAPRDSRIYVALGELARRQDQARGAANYYARALTFDEEHVDAMLGNALIILDSPLLDDSNAEPIIKRILEVPEGQLSARQLAMARFARAQLLFAQGKSRQAEEEQEQALLVQPNNPDIHLMIGRRMSRDGEHEAAARAIRKAIEHEPNRAGFHIELARVLMAAPGREGAREAVQALERARVAFPENPALLVLIGEAHAASGDLDRALAAYEDANKMREGELPEALFAIGSLLRQRRDFDRAREKLEEAAQAYQRRNNSRGRAQSVVEIARIQMQNRDLDGARETLVQAIDIDPDFADTYYFLGRVLSVDRRRRTAAREALDHYIKIAPQGEYVEPAQNLVRRL